MITIQEAFARGFAHEAAGRRPEARAIYEQILAAVPEHPGALLRIAIDEAAGGRVERARALLERALASARRQALPEHEIWAALGHLHLERGERAAARDAFEHACGPRIRPMRIASSRGSRSRMATRRMRKR